MEIRHSVERGDSLWSLAHRYLGNGTRYPQILDFHNQKTARCGLRHIDRPDLIFVGETILIPPRPKLPKPGNGTKAKGDHRPIPLNLKVTYAIGRDTPPIIYTATYGHYSIKTELSGEISIEIASNDRYRHSLELFMRKNPVQQAKLKLNDAYDPALGALTAKPEMVFESGRVKIKTPIATEAHLGPYTIRVQAENPMHMSGTLTPSTISGTMKVAGRDYKYNADIEFKVDVIWHQRPKAGPVTETAKQKAPYTDKKDPYELTGHTTKWDQVVVEKGVVVAVVFVLATASVSILYRIATRGGLQPAQIMPPFTHTIDRRNPRA